MGCHARGNQTFTPRRLSQRSQVCLSRFSLSLSFLDLVVRGLDLLLKRVSEGAMEPILLVIRAETNVLALEILLLVGNQEPCDQAADGREGGTDKENTLDALLGVWEGILDGGEHLSSDGCASLSHSRCQAQEVSAERGGEGLSATEERRDLSS